MEVLLRLQRRASYADYLAVEQNSDHRHELLDGVIVAIALTRSTTRLGFRLR
jgi:hypothetical protein